MKRISNIEEEFSDDDDETLSDKNFDVDRKLIDKEGYQMDQGHHLGHPTKRHGNISDQ